ncbi:sensor histidine kinase [Luteimonas sp. e5]
MSSTESPTRAWSMQRRLAWRLTLGIGLLLGALFVLLDVLVDRAMYERLDQFLLARAQAFAEQLAEHDHEHVRALLPAYDLAGHTEFFALYDRHGRLRLASANSEAGALPLPPGGASPDLHDTRLPDGHRGRAVALRLQGEFEGWLVMATERESWDRTERVMHGVLAGGILLTIVLAVLLCLWLLRQVFARMRIERQRLLQLQPDAHATPPTAHLPLELQPYARAVSQALQRLLDAAERERRFSRNVAHELRTPVSEVRASAESALQADDPAALRTGLETVLAANSRMERGIHALLALARHESGQIAPEPDPLDLVALVRQQAMSLAQVEGFALETRFRFALPDALWVHSDIAMLERIAANLLHNACEYSPRETPIEVGIDTAADGVWLEIINHAGQLRDDDVARLGERYWRAGGEDADARHAGLGLALSLALADALGLHLRFELANERLHARLGPFVPL